MRRETASRHLSFFTDEIELQLLRDNPVRLRFFVKRHLYQSHDTGFLPFVILRIDKDRSLFQTFSELFLDFLNHCLQERVPWMDKFRLFGPISLVYING